MGKCRCCFHICVLGEHGEGNKKDAGGQTGNGREQLQLGGTHKDHRVQLGLFSLIT